MDTWNERVNEFWDTVDESQPEAMRQKLESLLAERPEDDSDAIFELASLHDFLGNEAEAVPLYERALSGELSDVRRPQAVVQLASSLRNLGRPEDAVAVLSGASFDSRTAPGALAFLALALHDCGRHDEALRIALLTLSPNLPMYRRSIENYANLLSGES